MVEREMMDRAADGKDARAVNGRNERRAGAKSLLREPGLVLGVPGRSMLTEIRVAVGAMGGCVLLFS